MQYRLHSDVNLPSFLKDPENAVVPMASSNKLQPVIHEAEKIGLNKSGVYAENNFPIIQAVPWLLVELVCACAKCTEC